jgi:hypothetical protein
MSRNYKDLTALSEKIAHKSTKLPAVYKRFEDADKILGVDDEHPREKIVRKSYALIKKDLENIQLVKDKCLNHKIVLTDSHIIRLALAVVATFSEEKLIEASEQVPKMLTGRPRSIKKLKSSEE